MKQLFIDGKPVEYIEGGRGIMIKGKDVNGRECLVADHSVDPKLLKDNCAFRTNGHLYEVKTHPRFYSLD